MIHAVTAVVAYRDMPLFGTKGRIPVGITIVTSINLNPISLRKSFTQSTQLDIWNVNILTGKTCLCNINVDRYRYSSCKFDEAVNL